MHKLYFDQAQSSASVGKQMTYILSNYRIKCKYVKIQMQMSAPVGGAQWSNIVPLFLSEDVGRYNIGSIQCDGKAYIPEVEMAPTQYCASAPFHSLYLY